MSYSTLNGIEVFLIALGIVGWGLWWLVHVLKRSRPELRIGGAVAVGVGLRLAAVGAVGSLGLGSTLRGGDELGFTTSAHALASTPFLGANWIPSSGTNPLHVVLFALQYKLGGFTDTALRVTQVGIATVGLVLIAAAVYELAGASTARLAAWALVLEPAGIFFSGLLHKEPNIMLASGLIVFGATKFWLRMQWRSLLFVVLGAAIAITTRSYAGWFLVAGTVLVYLHAAMLHFDIRRGPGRSFAVIYAIVVAVIVLTPTLVALSSHQSLQQNLQISQNANTTSAQQAAVTRANGNNLQLEQVNFSTRSAIISNLPRRLGDLLLRPYVWQLGTVNQAFGLPGSLAALAVLVALAWFAWIARGTVLRSVAPILYPGIMLTVAYALAVGNAGTGFRYRTDLLPFGIASVMVLRERAIRSRAARILPRPYPFSGLGVAVAPVGAAATLPRSAAAPCNGIDQA